MKRVVLAIFLTLSILLIACVGTEQSGKDVPSDSSDTDVQILIDSRIAHISGMSVEEYWESIKEYGQYISIDKEGEDGITISVTEEQRQKWIDDYITIAEDAKAKFSKAGDNYNANISNGYDHVDLYLTMDVDPALLASTVQSIEVSCAYYQLFHDRTERWFVSFDIYNAETGKLVVSGDSDDGLDWTKEDWQKSQ